jgi:general L-amino acid transport system permease protein
MAATSDMPMVFVRRTQVEPLPPPPLQAGALGWLRTHLFSSPLNIVLTVLCIALIVWAVPPLIRFLFTDAVWSGSDRNACLVSPDRPVVGACWPFVRVWFSYFIYGFYPAAERWRVDVFFVLLACGVAWLGWLRAPRPDLGAI